MSRKAAVFAGFAFALVGLAFLAPGRPFAQDTQEAVIRKPKIFEETYQLINESDLNCSFYMHEQNKLLPDIRIIGAERMNEKSIFEDGDLIYLDKGVADGLEIGQLFLTVGLRAKVGKLGTVMERHGRARVVRIEDHMATAKVEKGCGTILIGDFLLPFEEEAGEIGKDLGYGDMDPNASKRGHVIYIENDFHISGSGQWALIDLGRQHCVQIGDQLNVFRKAKPNMPREAFASAIIVDVRGATSTIKILGARDAVDIGSEIQISTTR
ncbi:MAG TPA: hypothetical protein P5119_00365 [Candidatus Aminicenantes bacterium]|nr:hypothetical protein [Candidatus Aminicenantes bacterium]HRY63776.1 hypothetical protein [Candidatus Aminicenantes bacterium]HRZ70689.1 hypothetical protein [Candidatus Aminicenantes bacterium]